MAAAERPVRWAANVDIVRSASEHTERPLFVAAGASVAVLAAVVASVTIAAWALVAGRGPVGAPEDATARMHELIPMHVDFVLSFAVPVLPAFVGGYLRPSSWLWLAALPAGLIATLYLLAVDFRPVMASSEGVSLLLTATGAAVGARLGRRLAAQQSVAADAQEPGPSDPW